MKRLSIPGNLCVHCDTVMTGSLVCPGCGWVDPLTKRPPTPKSCENGNPSATPGCGCGYCKAVFDEWGEAARGFAHWLDSASDHTLRTFFGMERVP